MQIHSYPIILKPVDSAGTDNVYACYNKQELKKYFHKILNSTNVYTIKNKNVLCQEYIKGQQFAINTVSKDNMMRISELKKQYKIIINNQPFLNYMEFIDSSDVDYPIIQDYLEKTYQTLGIIEGAAGLK